MNNKVKMADICGIVRKFAPKFVNGYSMKRIFQIFCGLLTAGLLLTSCLGSSDDTTTVYDDMAISTFTLGKLNRYLHTTTSAGNDSVYKTTYTATSYHVSIDQLNHRIFNTDPLLTGTDMGHIICNVTTKNNGVVYIKSVTSDTLTYFNSGSDSIDFTQPRLFRVYATDGSGSRDYTVTLSVRSQEAGTMTWTKMPDGTAMPQTPTSGWEFAFNEEGNGINATNDHWATTIAGTYDTDTDLLPTANRSFTSWMLKNGLAYALLVGDNDRQEDAAVVWRKIIDSDKATDWVYMPIEEKNSYYLPKGHYYWLLPYTDGNVLAVDATGSIYLSTDQGITWRTSSGLTSPVSAVAGAATDGQGGLWLSEDGTGTVWYGKMTE